MNIEQEIAKAEARLAELKARRDAQKSGVPAHGQTVYALTANGVNYWRFLDSDITAWERGAVYLTREEAEAADRVRIAVTKINREVKRLNELEGWVADWGCRKQENSSPSFCEGEWEHVLSYGAQYQFTFLYGSKATWESVIKTHHAELEVVRKGGAA